MHRILAEESRASNQFRSVFWIAVVPAFIAVALVAFCVPEPKASRPSSQMRPLFRGRDLVRLDRRYWLIVLLAALLNLARSPGVFTNSRSKRRARVGLIPSVLIVMSRRR